VENVSTTLTLPSLNLHFNPWLSTCFLHRHKVYGGGVILTQYTKSGFIWRKIVLNAKILFLAITGSIINLFKYRKEILKIISEGLWKLQFFSRPTPPSPGEGRNPRGWRESFFRKVPPRGGKFLFVIYCYLVILAHLDHNYGQKMKLAESLWLPNSPRGGSPRGLPNSPSRGRISSEFTRSPRRRRLKNEQRIHSRASKYRERPRVSRIRIPTLSFFLCLAHTHPCKKFFCSKPV
jgi:hypothetical protein